MSRVHYLLGISLVFVGAGAGLAQQRMPGTPPPIPEQSHNERFHNQKFEREAGLRHVTSQAKSYVEAQAIGACMTKRNEAAAGKLVGGAMSSDPDYAQLSKAIAGKFSACYREGAVGVPLMVVNGALAESLFLAHPGSLRGATPAEAKAFSEDAAGRTIETVARCSAATAPDLAATVLRSQPGSEIEGAALNALFAGTPTCGLSGAPDGIEPMVQRSAIAAGLFHWSHRG